MRSLLLEVRLSRLVSDGRFFRQLVKRMYFRLSPDRKTDRSLEKDFFLLQCQGRGRLPDLEIGHFLACLLPRRCSFRLAGNFRPSFRPIRHTWAILRWRHEREKRLPFRRYLFRYRYLRSRFILPLLPSVLPLFLMHRDHASFVCISCVSV